MSKSLYLQSSTYTDSNTHEICGVLTSSYINKIAIYQAVTCSPTFPLGSSYIALCHLKKNIGSLSFSVPAKGQKAALNQCHWPLAAADGGSSGFRVDEHSFASQSDGNPGQLEML